MKKAGTTLILILFVAGTASAIAITSLVALGGAALAGGLGVCSVQAISGSDCISVGDTDGDVSGATSEEVNNNIYADGAFRESNRKAMVEQITSYSNQSFGISMAQAKLVGIQTLNNGSAKTTAHSRIQSEVNDFYSAYQMALVEEQNRENLRLEQSMEEINNTEDLETSDVFYVDGEDIPNTCSAYDDDNPGVISFSTHEETYELLNGTTVDAQSVTGVLETGSCFNTDPFNRTLVKAGVSESGLTDVHARNHDNTLTTTYVDDPSYTRAWNEIKGHRDRAIDNVERVVNEVYDNYELGQVEDQDVMTPLELLQLASTNYEDTGYYSYATLSLEYMGLSSNESYAFRLEWDNQDQEIKEATGQLFVNKEDFNSTIKVNETYDATEKDAWFVYAPNDGGKAVTEKLNGSFTVKSMIDTETGESVNETSVQETDVTTTSTENLSAQLDELREDYEKLNSRGPIGGAIGELTGWLNQLFPSLPELNDSVVGIGIVIIVAVILRLG